MAAQLAEQRDVRRGEYKCRGACCTKQAEISMTWMPAWLRARQVDARRVPSKQGGCPADRANIRVCDEEAMHVIRPIRRELSSAGDKAVHLCHRQVEHVAVHLLKRHCSGGQGGAGAGEPRWGATDGSSQERRASGAWLRAEHETKAAQKSSTYQHCARRRAATAGAPNTYVVVPRWCCRSSPPPPPPHRVAGLQRKEGRGPTGDNRGCSSWPISQPRCNQQTEPHPLQPRPAHPSSAARRHPPCPS